MNDQTVAREIHIHGERWAQLYDGYFSDTRVAREYVAAIIRTALAHPPAAIVDLGGGTGFILEQLVAEGIPEDVRLVNMDESASQLAMCRHPRIKTLAGAIQSFRREEIVKSGERLMVVCRSALHYGGIARQKPWLALVRAQMQAGEWFVHQSGCANDIDGALALDILFEMAGVDKWVPHKAALTRLLQQAKFDIVEDFAMLPLKMPAAVLKMRYQLTPQTLADIEAELRRICARRPDLLAFTPAGFIFNFPYRVFVCQAGP